MKKKSESKSASDSKAPEKSKHDFIVVGLGASAGGIKALQEFFAAMPPNSGMAFVVILHLSPEHESNLAEIIQARTAMAVTLVTKANKVEPNNVYVIPPNKHLEMVDGIVRCAKPAKKTGARVAIDVFFRTLAEAYERNAVCVVMSGTGTDGTLGLKRVKESNGFAVVQSPEDAEYDQMPQSAIATRLVDWILPVEKMPEKLIEFKESSERLHLTGGDDGKVAKEIQANESLREIITLIRVRTGHDFSHYKTPTLVRRVARHLQIHALEDIPAYLKYLREKPEEIQSLLKNLLINVTNFFRDKEAWNALEREVAPNIFAEKKANETIRVWSAGCASGEEAYSLAIVLHEYASKLAVPPKIQVFATDIDDEAIAEARDNRYPQAIEADVSTERLKRFFVREGGYYRVKKEIRDAVLFASHNVLRDPPFSRLDLIACRNLPIYLNRETQERLMRIFHFALDSGGFLFLGSSETAESSAELFKPVDKKQRIYSRRPAPLTHFAPPQIPAFGRWQVNIPQTKIKSGRERVFTLGEVHYKLLDEFAPPSILVNSDFEIQYMSETAGRFLEFKGGAPQNNLLRLVNPDLLPDLRAALFNARREREIYEFRDVHCVIGDEKTTVNITVRPVDLDEKEFDLLLVILDEAGVSADAKQAKEKPARAKGDAVEAIVLRLEDELARTKENLRATIEQHEISIEELKASNEELQAINEELHSASEELETSKEELQSVNEELTTVNYELKEKIEETNRLNSDLRNLISSTDIATIFLDRELRIRRVTPQVENLFNLSPSDIGRPLAHFTHNLDYDNLTEDAAAVLRTLRPLEREIRDKDERFYLARFLPYRTVDDKIDGAALNFIDITERKKAERIIGAERVDALAIVETLREPFIILDKNLRVVSASRSFYESFKVAPEDTVGKYIYDLGNRQWNIPALRELLEDILPSESQFQDFEVTHEFEDIGQRTMILNAREIRREDEGRRLILLAIADVTERRAAEKAGRAANELFSAFISATSEVVYEMSADWREMRFLKGKEFIVPTENPRSDWTEEYIPEDEKKRVWTAINKAIETKSVYELEHRVICLDKSVGWMFWRAVPILNEQGEIEKWFGAASDITTRKHAEERVRHSEERFRLIVESATEYAIITIDEISLITSWNIGAERLFGYQEQEVLGKSDALLFLPEDREREIYLKEIENAKKTGIGEDDRWLVRKDGLRFYASGAVMPMRDGDQLGFVKIIRDQTDKIRAEAAINEKAMLEKLVKMQEEERRRIARDLHDHFGQQITALRMKLAAIIKDGSDDQRLREQTVEADDIAKRLDAEVDFIAWELRPVALDDLGLRVILRNFVKEWSHHTGIKAEFHDAGFGKKHLDFSVETNLYRIAQEALNNIYKHAEATIVSVLLEKRRDKIVLIVEDNGKGFDMEDEAVKKNGMGLSGISERAKMLGGEFEIESTLNGGTTLFIRVPARQSASKLS